MSKALSILVVAAPADALFVANVVRDYGDAAAIAERPSEALALCARNAFDVAFVAISSRNPETLALVHHLKALQPNLGVIALAHPHEWAEVSKATSLGIDATATLPTTGDSVLVALERIREHRMLLAERSVLTAAELASRHRAATYARAATLVSETDATSVALRVIEACAEELPCRAAALFLPASANRFRRVAVTGMAEGIGVELDRSSAAATDAASPFRVEGSNAELSIFADEELLAVARFAGVADGIDEATKESLRIIGTLASGAFASARKFEALARVGVKDPDTSAYTFAYFGDVAGREIDRAARHGRRFALLTLACEGMPDGEPGAKLRREIVDSILDSVRDSDVLARVEDDEHYLLLPETGLLGALACRRRIDERLETLAATRNAELGTFDIAIGIAVFPSDGTDLGRLLRTSRRRAEESRSGVLRSSGLRGAQFWQSVDLLLGSADDTGLARDGSIALHADLLRVQDLHGLSRHVALPTGALWTIAHAVTGDALRRGGRGTIYASSHDGVTDALVSVLEQTTRQRARAWVLGPTDASPDRAARLRLAIEDPRLRETCFLLCLTELGGYALVARSIAPQTVLAYHSSDLDVVDALVSSLQGAYHLQPEVR